MRGSLADLSTGTGVHSADGLTVSLYIETKVVAYKVVAQATQGELNVGRFKKKFTIFQN